MTTIKDVARLAGVSPSTVSKYINGGSVRKENIASIRSAIARLDYRVNPIARSLKTRRSYSVGILLPSLAAPFFSSVFMASDRVLRERGYHSMISCYYADHGLERDYLSYLMNAGADGLIYVPENLTAEEFQELTAHRDIPGKAAALWPGRRGGGHHAGQELSADRFHVHGHRRLHY